MNRGTYSVARLSPGPVAQPSARRRDTRPGRLERTAAAAPDFVAATDKPLALPVTLLLVALFIPWVISAGAIVITPYRLVLILMVLPCLAMWLGGRAGRIRIPDLAVVGYALWCIISLAVDHGLDVGIKSGGVMAVETIGGYFVARCFIRSAEDFRRMVVVLFGLVMLLLPFALVEWLTGQNLLLQIFSTVLPSIGIYRMPARLGLQRVQAVFDHPILFGVVCGSAFALTFTVLGWSKSMLRRWGMAALVFLTVLTSLSSGPISAVAAQAGLLAWGNVLGPIKSRWKILIGLIVLGIVTIELFSKRPLPNVLLSSFALDLDSAYYRVLIWNFGSQSALNHPWFGVGFGMWDHPSWMTQSIDMFWLYHAIVFGIPAAFMMLLAFFSAMLLVGATKGLDARLYNYRMGYLICLAGFFIVGWTVHFWNATYVLFMFLVGSGIWLADAKPQPAIIEPGPEQAVRRRTARRETLRPREPAAARRGAARPAPSP